MEPVPTQCGTSNSEIPVRFPFVSDDLHEMISTYLKTTVKDIAEVISAHPIQPFLQAQRHVRYPYQFDYLPVETLDVYKDIEQRFGRDALGKYNKVIALFLLSGFRSIAEKQPIWPLIKDGLPQTIETNLKYMFEASDRNYVHPDDFMLKDIRTFTGRSFSFGPRLIDFDVFVRPRICRYNGWKANLKCAWFLTTRTRGLGPFIRSHVDHRHFEHRTTRDVFKSRCLIGEILTLLPNLKGSVGSGWMVDPALAEVSPRYKERLDQDEPQFSFLRYDGPSDETTRLALSKSKTRQAAFERGDYKPASYTLLRSRKGLIRRSERAKKKLESEDWNAQLH